MWNWFLKLLGRGEPATVAGIMAPLKQKQDELKQMKAQRHKSRQDNLERIRAIHSENTLHEAEIKTADGVIGQLDSILNPKD